MAEAGSTLYVLYEEAVNGDGLLVDSLVNRELCNLLEVFFMKSINKIK